MRDHVNIQQLRAVFGLIVFCEKIYQRVGSLKPISDKPYWQSYVYPKNWRFFWGRRSQFYTKAAWLDQPGRTLNFSAIVQQPEIVQGTGFIQQPSKSYWQSYILCQFSRFLVHEKINTVRTCFSSIHSLQIWKSSRSFWQEVLEIIWTFFPNLTQVYNFNWNWVHKI